MRYQVLSSGSKGNLIFIQTKETNILLDAGISPKEIKNRSDINLQNIDAIFITHEHSDHVKYLEQLVKLTSATIYISELSFKQLYPKYIKSIEGLKVKFLQPNTQIKLKDVNVFTLNLQHDSACCYGYIFVSEKKSLAYCTDTGFIPLPYIELLKKVDSLIIEANHDVAMLQNSSRPWYLKNRILSINGHMSNKICGEILNKIINARKVKNVVLAHLSEECNTEELAIDTVLENIQCDYMPNFYIAKQKESLMVIEV